MEDPVLKSFSKISRAACYQFPSAGQEIHYTDIRKIKLWRFDYAALGNFLERRQPPPQSGIFQNLEIVLDCFVASMEGGAMFSFHLLAQALSVWRRIQLVLIFWA